MTGLYRLSSLLRRQGNTGRTMGWGRSYWWWGSRTLLDWVNWCLPCCLTKLVDASHPCSVFHPAAFPSGTTLKPQLKKIPAGTFRWGHAHSWGDVPREPRTALVGQVVGGFTSVLREGRRPHPPPLASQVLCHPSSSL